MKKRTLSEFMCMEMLYDYKSGKLDALRAQAVEETLASSPRVRDELKKLSLGLSYCDKMKEVKVSLPMVEAIANQPKQTERVFGRLAFSAWPQPMKWGFEAVIVAVAIALFVTQMPELFKGREDAVVVRKFDTPTEASHDDVPEVKAPAEVPVQTDVPVGHTEAEVAKAPAKPVSDKPLVFAPVVKPVSQSTQTPPESKPTQVAQVDSGATPDGNTKPAVESAAKKPKRQGYVYRLVMYVDNVDQVTPEIVALIESHGGEKAGEVELGWRRKGGSYFHFTLPQPAYEEVTQQLKKYSDYNIIKSEHPRVMPEGSERFILWVEEKKN